MNLPRVYEGSIILDKPTMIEKLSQTVQYVLLYMSASIVASPYKCVYLCLCIILTIITLLTLRLISVYLTHPYQCNFQEHPSASRCQSLRDWGTGGVAENAQLKMGCEWPTINGERMKSGQWKMNYD
jgi:hypothetical protein